MNAAAQLQGQRVLVTGANGFVGRHIVLAGQAWGSELHALGRSPPPTGCMAHRADLNDREAIRAAVRDVAPHTVINCASPGVAYGTADFREILTSLTAGTEALLSACAECPEPPHFIHIGTGLEYAVQDRPIAESDPIVPSASRYGAAKAAASAVLGGFAGLVPITVLRPFYLYGTGDEMPRLGNMIVDRALQGLAVDVSAGEQLRDFLHVEDFAALVWQVAAEDAPEKHFAVFNAGEGSARPLRDYLAALSSALSEAGQPVPLPIAATNRCPPCRI
jgi:nucleoside-diphosphate-sugar epimerase